MKKTGMKSSEKKTHPAQVLSPGRRILFRPERSKYVRKEKAHSACVFCSAEAVGISEKTLCVHKSEHSMVIINKFPYNSGHLLVLPRRHCGDLLDLSEIEYADLHLMLKECLRALKEIYKPAGVNIGINHGAAAGAGIPQHLHYHLVPRWVGDLNFFPLLTQTKVVIETAEETYFKYQRYFQKTKSKRVKSKKDGEPQ